MPETSPVPDTSADAPSAAAPWISTQHEMETAARPSRTRLFRMRMKSGHVRVAGVAYFHARVASSSDSRVEHLYRVQLSWLGEFDPRDGKTQHFAERTSTGRAANALQFRVLEMTAADGQHVSAARLGPRGQIVAEPVNIGIMSLLRALLVEWVAGAHPGASLLTGSLHQVHALTLEQNEQRDQFFIRSGFTVKPTADGGGTFHAESIKALKTTWNAEKAQELTAPMLAEAIGAQLEMPLLRRQVDALTEQLAATQAEKRVSQTLQRLWLAITVLAVVLGLIFGIQPRLR
jgi:hypothetical protein